MNKSKTLRSLFCLILLTTLPAVTLRLSAEDLAKRRRADSSLPPGATRCDLTSPLSIDFFPLNQPRVGEAARYEVQIDSRIDPDLISDIQVEYPLSPRLQLIREAQAAPETISKFGASRLHMAVLVPDETRHSVRARVVARLRDGRTIASTAQQWIDLGDPDPPEELLGRVDLANGDGIRVYRGVTVRN